MDVNTVPKKLGRPRKYLTDEDRILANRIRIKNFAKKYYYDQNRTTEQEIHNKKQFNALKIAFHNTNKLDPAFLIKFFELISDKLNSNVHFINTLIHNNDLVSII